MVEKKPKGSGQSKDSLKNTKSLNLNTKAIKANSKKLQSLTKKLGSSFTSLKNTMKSSNGKLTKAIGTNTKALEGLSKAISGIVIPPPAPKVPPPAKPVKPVTPEPTPVENPVVPVTPEPKQPKKEAKPDDGGGKVLGGVMISVTDKLVGAVNGLYAAQSDMAKVFTRTGKENMIGFGKINKTFGLAGLTTAAQMGIHTDMMNQGLGEYSRSLDGFTSKLAQPKLQAIQAKTLAEFKNLGLDSKSLAGVLAHNSQVIGGSASQSIQLADTMAGLGAAYGISTDKLVSSIQALSQTFMKSASVFGAETAGAGQEAIANIIAKMGPAQAKNVESLGRTLLSGTKEASVTAMKLGIRLEDLNSKNSAQVEKALMQGLGNLNKSTATGGSTDAGLWVNDLTKALGGNDEMLNLARHAGQLTQKQIDTSLKDLAAAARGRDAKANIDQMINDSIKGLLPIIEALVTPLSWIAKAVGMLSTTVTMILMQMMARKIAGKMQGMGTKMKNKAQGTVDNMAMKGNARFQPAKGGNFVNTAAGKAGVLSGKTKLVGGSIGQKSTLALAKSQKMAARLGAKLMQKGIMKVALRGIGMLMGPLGIILAFLPDLLGMFGISLFGDSEAEKDRKKTNELLAKPSKQETQLAGIARMLTQSNIYAEQANVTAESTLVATKDNKVDPEATKPVETFADIPTTPGKAVA